MATRAKYNRIDYKKIARGIDRSAAKAEVELPSRRLPPVSPLSHFLGNDGFHTARIEWSARRRIMQVLRKACAVMGPGQKSRIGRLGAGTAIGTALAAFATPAFAQIAISQTPTGAGTGATASAATAIAIGNGSSATIGGATALGDDADATAADATAIGSQVDVSGVNSIGIGNQMNVTGGQSFVAVAAGGVTTVNASDSVIINPGVTARTYTGTNLTAVGSNAVPTANYATALGSGGNTSTGTNGVRASGVGSLAIGGNATAGANASGADAISIGGQSAASTAGSIAVGLSANASGPNTTAIGANSSATLASATALGFDADATGTASTAIGFQVDVSGIDSMGIGNEVNVTGNNVFAAIGSATPVTVGGADSVVINPNSTATSYSAANITVLGSGANATLDSATAIGRLAVAGGANSVSVGRATSASGPGSVAIGSNATSGANAAGTDAIAVGGQSTAAGSGAIALGGQANAAVTDSIAVGRLASATTGISSVAIGVSATASNTNALAAGRNAQASGAAAVAVGNTALSVGQNSVALGNNALVTLAAATSAVAIGDASRARAASALAVGNSADASAANAAAIGASAVASAAGAIALGQGATASNTNSVALGSTSTTAAANTGTFTLTGGTPAGTTAFGTVSFGTTGSQRQVQNVAAGVLSATSTDAVNGSQLFSVATAVNNTGTSLATALGGGSAVAADGTLTAPTYNIGGTNYGNVNAALEAVEALAGSSGVTYFNVNSALANSTATGTDAIAIGPQVAASGASSVAIGSGATAANGAGSVAIGQGQVANGRGSVAIGDPNTATGTGAVVLGADSTSIGNGSVALGNLNTANNSAAVGNEVIDRVTGTPSTLPVSGATNFAPNAVAIGNNNDSRSGVAVGVNNRVNAEGTGQFMGVAIGGENDISGAYATGIGVANRASNTAATAIGVNNTASGSATVAMGRQNTASGSTSIAIGNVATANQTNAIALGHSTQATGAGAIAIGGGNNGPSQNLDATAARASATNAVAIGTNTTATAANSTALGNSSDATGASSVAIGNGSTASGSQSIAIGTGNNVSGANSGAIGDPNTITGSGSYALGNNNTINANNAFAIGNNITIAAGRDGSVGIGNNSTVAAPNTGAFTLNGGAAMATAPTAVVSVGATGAERQIQNVAAGVVSATSTDAINGSQLFTTASALNNLADTVETITGGSAAIAADGTLTTAPSISVGGTNFANVTAAIQAADDKMDVLGADAAAALGGGATFDPSTGDITAPSYSVAGGAQTSVGAAFSALDTANTLANNGVAAAIGGGAAVAANGTVTAPTVNVNGTTYNNLTDAIQAAGGGYSLVASATGTGTVSGATATAIGAGETVTLTAGNNLQATQAGNEVQFALNPVLTGIASMAITGGATLSGTGIAMNGDGITGLAAGALTASSTDAINGGQINTGLASVAANFGAGSTFNPASGTVTSPAYSIAGTTYSNVGDAFTAVDGLILGISNGTTGLVQQVGGSPGNGLITVGVNTGGSEVAIGGTNGDRKLSGVADGTIAATSSDAMNGSQLFDSNQQIANTLGGGSIADPLTGFVTAPSISVGGGTYANLTDAIEAGDDKADATGADVAAALGGGAAFDPNTGNLIAPGYGVAGGTQNNVGAALSALDAANIAANNGVALAIGGGMAIGADGTVTPPTVNVNGTTYSSLTDAIQAAGGGYSLVASSTGTGTVSGAAATPIGAGETVTLTAGDNLQATQLGNEVQFALNPVLTGITSIAVTGGPSISAAGIGMNGGGITGLGAGSTAPGSTDAVNGGQFNTALASLATHLGGGSSYDPLTGTVTPPNYTVGGNSHTNLGSVVGAVDTNLSTLNSQVTNILSGTTGLVQQTGGAPGTGQITVGAATGGTSVSIAGTDGNRTLSGVAPGSVAAISTDAVNGSQLNALANSVSSALGGGASFDPASGAITPPSYSIGGTSYSSLANALGGVDSSLTTLNTQVTNILSGGTGIVQQSGGSPGNGQITVGAATGGTSVSFAGTDGDRVLTGVAAGNIAAGSTEAVNGGQIFALANAIGVPVGPSGTVTPPSFTIEGSTYNNAGDAFSAINTAISGGGIKYFRTNSTMGDSVPLGENAIAIGPVSGAGGDQSISMGLNASAIGLNAIAIGTGSTVSGTGSGAFGDPNVVTGSGSYAFGNDNVIAANNAFAMGNNIAIAAGLDGAVALGNNSTVAAPNAGAKSVNGGSIAATAPSSVVSVGSAGGERQITNVAAGVVSASSTDAVNGSQLYAVGNALNQAGTGLAAALGGGASVAPDGTVAAPSYTVGGVAHGNVGSAIAASNMLAVQYAPDAGGQPTNRVVLRGNGSGAPVAMTNVAPGAVLAGSTDAVNGGQLFAVQQTANGALQRSGGTMSGNIAMGGNRVTGLGAPVDSSDAVTKAYVDGLQSQQATQFNLLTQGLNSAFGRIERNSQGVALAIAMGGGYLDPDKDFSLWGSWGHFDGYNALSAQGYARLSDDVVLNAGLSFGFEEELVGARVGVGIQF